MITLRCTEKLRKKLKLPKLGDGLPSTTALGDWFGQPVSTRHARVILLVSEKSRLAILIHARQLDRFEQRIGFMAAGGLDVSGIRFATAFGRALDYYSGMVFEIYDAKGKVKWPLIAGGRYDRLMTLLGSEVPTPAVGFAAWIEELEQAGAK